MKQRCEWVTDDLSYIAYHDHEWGIPVYDDQHLFEMLSLEGAQAGLSWITILKRRDNYRTAFDQFDPVIVSIYGEEKVEQQLLQNAGIIRNKLKVRSVITNAKAFMEVQAEFGSFSKYVWEFVGGKPLINNWASHVDVPVKTEESEALSKDLKKRGFKFVGPVICYAFMQAVGMVNDHTRGCWLAVKS